MRYVKQLNLDISVTCRGFRFEIQLLIQIWFILFLLQILEFDYVLNTLCRSNVLQHDMKFAFITLQLHPNICVAVVIIL
jgi:hypothetical protein